MKTIFLPRQYQVVIQDDDGVDQLFYNIFLAGRRGIVYSLNGAGMRYLVGSHMSELIEKTGITELEADMNPRVASAMAKILPKDLELVLIGGVQDCESLPMQRVVIRRKTV